MKAFRFILGGLFAATLFACTGGGSSTPNPYAGTWQGNYTIPSLSQNGVATITVSTNGAVTGNGTNTSLGADFNIAGSISEDGEINGSLSGDLTGTLNGTLAISTVNGHLTGTVNQTVGSTTVSSNFDLVKQ